MRMRSALFGGLLTVFMFLGVTVSAQAGTEWNIGGSGANSFSSLEALRQAVVDGYVTLGDGDVIVLHKDDNSLTQPFPIPEEWRITVRSASGTPYTISSQVMMDSYFFGDLDTPNMTFENIRINGTTAQQAYGVFVNSDDGGTVTISNSIIENVDYGAWFEGDLDVNIINTIFRNNSEVSALYVNNEAGDTTNINITMNQNAPDTIIWGESDSSGPAMTLIARGGDLNVNFNIAEGKILNIRNQIFGSHYSADEIDIEKNGAGTLKLTGGQIDYDVDDDGTVLVHGNFNFVVNEGRVHFTGKDYETSAVWYDPLGSITFKDGTVFKPTATKGDLEDENRTGNRWTSQGGWLWIDTFHSEEGSKLEVGYISEYRAIPNDKTASAYVGVVVLTTPAVVTDGEGNILAYNSTIASTMKIQNDLLDVNMKYGVWEEDSDTGAILIDESDNPEEWNAILIDITRLEDLSTLKGVGEYADVYRKLTTLTDEERDMLDDIYARGGLTHSDRAFLQTLSGSIVTNSLLGMRHNWANLLRKINRRVTDYQHEEVLELGITGDEFCRYDKDNPVVDYVQMWAGIDKSWMNQQDRDSLAGYDYNPYGFHIGVERHCENLIIGGVVRYDDGTMKLQSNNRTKTDITTVMGSAYVSWASEGIYITGSVHAGYGWNESHSNYLMPTLASTAKTGNYGSTMYGAHVEVGYMIETELGDLPFRVTPYGSLGYAKLHRQSVTESGAGNLDRHFRRGDWDLWEPSLGVRLAMPIDRGGYTLIPTADIAWSRSTGDGKNDSGDAYLIADPSNAWKISTMAGNRSALRLSGGLQAHFARNLRVGFEYDFEWRRSYSSHQLNLNMSMGF